MAAACEKNSEKNPLETKKKEKNYMIRVSRWLQGDYYVSLLGNSVAATRGNNALLHFMVKWTKRRLKHTIVKEKNNRKEKKNSFQVLSVSGLGMGLWRFVLCIMPFRFVSITKTKCVLSQILHLNDSIWYKYPKKQRRADVCVRLVFYFRLFRLSLSLVVMVQRPTFQFTQIQTIFLHLSNLNGIHIVA